MNSLKLMIIGILFFVVSITKAQVTVNVNLGNPPEWGPVGYTEVRYYYLPDIEAYYDVETSVFIYFGNGVWIRDRFLPTRYRNYDLYGGYKVVMTDYRGNAPYHNFKEYKVKYKKGYRGPSQKTIGSKEKKEIQILIIKRVLLNSKKAKEVVIINPHYIKVVLQKIKALINLMVEEKEKNKTGISLFYFLYPGGDSNSHVFRHTHLKRTCIPFQHLDKYTFWTSAKTNT